MQESLSDVATAGMMESKDREGSEKEGPGLLHHRRVILCMRFSYHQKGFIE